ncbi:NAD(P)-dependent dehydrogenase (short-subunit alcohol dehydrogenase family) [Streptosporangium becharense]|uniref:NAD(P)-dependent dehydrogenase (Short-subunit alcohol dehydrogenase family) n=1 Tax=Streptosporangium becharense TaxID=1816182 RepID=A0A7W9IG22_9ACTN|nr:SDR family oxidoreductase [Streptosporangium becharense]MBB2908985.1 NAD(P)-dependent dehydrogenase (short-subunit alcohol dehydrogenase family) [Streptosporangium becharense]MBB5819997.1 NAD(P)-dependent dehydrogenase (short-subunit alcohol dehydrogenase family) [Streptosporangium becharense]
MTNTALITGASRGLGLALARSLAADGWKLILTARGRDALARAADDLGALALAGDVADPAHRDRLARAARDLGGLDLLVNNASGLGPVPMRPLADYPVDTLEELLRVNVLAPLALIQATLPGLRERRGAIVNVSSDAAVEAYEGWGGYAATKAALERLSHVLAVEEPDVAVWWFDPGEMRTAMLADAVGAEEAATAPAPETVVPTLRRLVAERPASGRIRHR